MVYTAYTFKNVFNYRENDIYWCTADIGWITGHSYILYGPLLNGATTVIFEGVPTYPEPDRFWEVIENIELTNFILRQLQFVLWLRIFWLGRKTRFI
jgi:acetyl-CoA synthetase